MAPNVAPLETLSLKLETPHLRVMADRAAAATLRQIADALEADYPRIAADIGRVDLRVVTVAVWADAESFYRTMEAPSGVDSRAQPGMSRGRPTSGSLMARARPHVPCTRWSTA